MKARIAGIVVTAGLVVLGLAAPALPQEPGSRQTAFTFSGTCIDAIFPIGVELERVRAAVPESYSIFLGATGSARLYVSAVSCDESIVDGAAGPHAIYSDLLVQVEPPRGSGTPLLDGHFLDGYWVWLVTDERRVHTRLTELGMYSALDEQASFTPVLSGGRVTGFDMNVAWSHSPFRLRGNLLGLPSGQLPPFQNRFWHDGPRGRIEARLNFTDAQFGLAQLKLTTPMGSPLARMLGNQCAADPGMAQTCSVAGPGILAPRMHFEHDIRVGRAPRAGGRRERPCLARRSPIGRRNIGRIRLGHSRRRLLRLGVLPVRRTRRFYRYCVKRSKGRVSAVFSRRGRVSLVSSTARAHGNRGVRPGASARRLRRAYPGRRRIGRGIYRANASSRQLVGVRKGRVRFVGVARRSVLRSRRALRRHLRLAGL